MLINLSAETVSMFLRGTKSDRCGRSASVYHVYPVSLTTGDLRVDFLRGWGLVILCAEMIKNPF